MKCPKCGNITEFIGQTTYFDFYRCETCGHFEEMRCVISQPDPTPTEMWEWLGRNYSVVFLHRYGERDYLELAHGFWNYIVEENGFDDCIKAAYAAAKKQEVTE